MSNHGATGALSAEVEHLTNSPYPASLKSLFDITRESNRSILQTWASRNPSQVPAFAAVLLEDLELSSCALDILDAFSSVNSVREAVLDQRPTFLNDLLSAAACSSSGFDRVSNICVSFLAEPLPQGLPLPFNAQSFLSQLKDRAISFPSQETIEPVYTVLDGACAGLLEVSSSAELNKLQDTFSRLIRGRKDSEQYVTALCLALLAKIHCQVTHRIDNSEPIGGSRAPQGISKSHDQSLDFFSGQASQKALHMAVTQMIGACSPELQPYSDRTLNRARAVTEIAAVVKAPLLKEWVQTKPMIVHKLHQKLRGAGLHPLICLEGFALACSLSDVSEFSDRTIASFESALTTISGASTSDSKLQRAIKKALPHLSKSRLSTELYRQILENSLIAVTAIDPLCSSPDYYEILLLELKRLAVRSTEVASSVLKACSSPSVLPKLSAFSTGLEHSRAHQSSCVQNTLTALILVSAFQSPSEASPLRGTIFHLVEGQSTMSLLKGRHSYIRKQSTQLSLVEQPSSQEVAGASRHWRERLRVDLQMQSKMTFDSTVRLMAKACEDLESRCESVEQPLCEAQATSAQLRDELSEMQQRAGDLERQVRDRTLESEDLRNRKEQVDQDLAVVSEMEENSRQRISELENDLQHARKEHSHEAEQAREARQNEELKLRATIANHAEKLHEQKREIETLKRQEQELADSREREREQAQASAQKLSDQLANAEITLEAERNTVSTTVEQKDRAVSKAKELTERNESLGRAIEQSNADNEHLHKNNETVQTWHQQHLQELQSEHDEQVCRIQAEAATHQTALEGQVHILETSLLGIKNDHRAEVAHKDSRIHDLQQQLRRTSEACRAREADLQEAHQIRSNILATFGVDVNAIPAVKRTGRSHQATHKPPSRTQRPEQPPKADSTSLASFTSASSQNSGPTPKRPKPRRQSSPKAPTIDQPPFSTRPRAHAHSRAASETQVESGAALQALSPNRRRASRASRSDVRPTAQKPAKTPGSGRATRRSQSTAETGSRGRRDELAGGGLVRPAFGVDENVLESSFPDLSFGELRAEDWEGATTEL